MTNKTKEEFYEWWGANFQSSANIQWTGAPGRCYREGVKKGEQELYRSDSYSLMSALTRLGYTDTMEEDTAGRIYDYFVKHGHLRNCDLVKKEHEGALRAFYDS